MSTKKQSNPKWMKERDLKIVDLVRNLKNASEVSSYFAIGNARVGKIYKEVTGESIKSVRDRYYRTVYKKRIRNKKIAENKVKFRCLGCNKKIRASEYRTARVYCTDCKDYAKYIDVTVKVKCPMCRRKFHPRRNISLEDFNSGKVKTYCSHKCRVKDFQKRRSIKLTKERKDQLVSELRPEMKFKELKIIGNKYGVSVPYLYKIRKLYGNK